MTNEELVSRIVNSIKALNKDEHISRRYILRTARNKAKFFMSQKLRDISLFREDNLFTSINCFELKPDEIVRCNVVEFRRCHSLMKSKCKLPDLIYSKYGNSIDSIVTIDGMTEFLPIDLTQYRLNQKRQYSNFVKQNYFYIQDGYLYLPDCEIEAVDIVLITTEPELVDEISTCNCNKDKNKENCKSVWEHNFVCSDKLLEPVIQETLRDILASNKQIVEDENPNLTSIQKDKTIQ